MRAEVHMIEFAIHPVAVAGGMPGLSPMPGRTRHGGADWPRLVDRAPGLVITMTPLHELARMGSLPQDLANIGIPWAHLPVADMGAPDAATQAGWTTVQARALAMPGRRGRLPARCFGGRGRAGMVASRPMVAAGERPQAALARPRAVRPCAVATAAQRQWAQG